MFGDKQKQNVEAEGIAIQAGQNVTLTQNNGMSFSEVKELCLLFLRDNFPALREEAIKAAEDNVRSFSEKLESKIVESSQNIVLEKFKDPDVQATINDAVQACARKGERANTEILTNLITKRVSSNSNDFLNIVLSEAVLVAPKLTKQQISYLSLIHYLTSCSINGVVHISAIEPMSINVFTAVVSGFGVSESQKQHLQYAGACSIVRMSRVNIYDGWMNSSYKSLGYTDLNKFKSDIIGFCPFTERLLNEFDKDSYSGEISLTSVGQAIAIANLATMAKGMDYSTWIN
ncbi:LPO_1073/Vpar_1526 family protein [Photobacterium phosphoreum]|uniref:LPO_1073/Vpar_1526 family protein n=1 Tax=Photobacterium phosphoreum TaxID=659 RepID=UPI0024B94D5D|nr:LPO_1073/Vpar_1526 family protein [Photobacterium phosphoreum]